MLQAACNFRSWNRKEELTTFCKGSKCTVVCSVISLLISCILIWFVHYFLVFFCSVAIFNFPLNSWIYYLANELQLECFLVTFFPKNIIRLKFLALASCLLSSLCISPSSLLTSSTTGLACLATTSVFLPAAFPWARGRWRWRNASEEEAEGRE